MDKGTEDPACRTTPFPIVQFMKQSLRMVTWMKRIMEINATNEMIDHLREMDDFIF